MTGQMAYPSIPSAIELFQNRLCSHSKLDERAAILGLPTSLEQFTANSDIVAIGELVDHSCLVSEGLVGRFATRTVAVTESEGEVRLQQTPRQRQASASAISLSRRRGQQLPYTSDKSCTMTPNDNLDDPASSRSRSDENIVDLLSHLTSQSAYLAQQQVNFVQAELREFVNDIQKSTASLLGAAVFGVSGPA